MSILTHTNYSYDRHDVDNVDVTNPSSTAYSLDPGDGWTNFSYLNFNGDYVRHDVNGVVGVVSAYQKHDVDNTPVAAAPYVRHDINNNPVPNPAPVPPTP